MLELRPYQSEAVEAVFDYWASEPGNPLLELATGCHAKGTGILMLDGSIKPVEMVSVGDVLMGPDSKPRTVLALARGREEMYKVKPTKGNSFVVNKGHILSLKTTNTGHAKTQYPSGVRGGVVQNISVSEYLGKTKSWKHIHKLWRTGVDFPERDPPPVPAWVVGAMLGDGHMKFGVSICNPDHEVLDEICDYVESIGLRLRISQKENNKAWDVFFVDDDASKTKRNKFVSYLEGVGVFGKIAHNKFIPDAYKLGSRKTRLEVLAGLLDADGSLTSNNGYDFVSKSQVLANDVAFVARSLGLAAYTRETIKFCQTGGGGTYWRVSISGDTDAIPMRISRKKASSRKQKKSPLVTGFELEPVGVDDYFGFSLDGDHLYLTSDFTVHHNTGKSMVQATLIQRLLGGWPDMRVVCVTHVAELISQNLQELYNIWPMANAGVYSAGLGRREAHAPILFCGIQTVHSKAERIGHVDVLIVDEAHLIPSKATTMYGRFIAALREINPDMKILGLTATPYRLDSGRLDEGDGRLFDRVVYTYGIAEGIRDGFLCPLISKATATDFDLSGVGRRGGDYVPGALQAAVDKKDVTRRAVDEIVAYGRNRRSWMAFCAGVEHAVNVRDEIRSRGYSCEVVTGETPKDERRRIIEDFKAGRVKCVTNNSVLTTGFNAPAVDLIAALRPTLSVSLYVQMMGRGTRLSPATGKQNCLVLDFAGLVRQHGPVDAVQPRKPGKGDGEAPIKVCPHCHAINHAAARQCMDCGAEFDIEDKPKHQATAGAGPILAMAKPEWLPVQSRRFRYHDKPGGTPSVRAEYSCGMVVYKQWCCPQHKGHAKALADRYWRDHGGTLPAPADVNEWLRRQGELSETEAIMVKPAGKYWSVERVRAVRMEALDHAA